MSNKDRLLSDKELEAEMYALAITFDSGAMGKPRVRARVMEDIKARVALINTQKRLYAESVIGEDDTLDKLPAPKWNVGKVHQYKIDNRNELRAEQRASIK